MSEVYWCSHCGLSSNSVAGIKEHVCQRPRTLRDDFAIQCAPMAYMLQNAEVDMVDCAAMAAKIAYCIADAMLKEREK